MMPQHCTVLMHQQGWQVPDGSDPAAARHVTALDGLEITWGRSASTDQPDASTCTLDVALSVDYEQQWQVLSFLLAAGVGLSVLGSVGEAPGQDERLFYGNVTDVTISWDAGWPSPRASIIAVDASNEVRSEVVGAEPFPPESAFVRLNRAVYITSTRQWIGAAPDTTRLEAAVLAAQDVDAQAWGTLIEGYATSTDHVAWPVWGVPPPGSIPGGDWAWPGTLFTSLAARPATSSLHKDLTGQWIIVGPRTTLPNGTVQLSSCWATRAGAAWQTASAETLTRVTVSWIQDAIDPESLEPVQIERAVTATDTTLEPAVGVHGAAVTTTLNSEPQALALARAVLARSSHTAWRLQGVALDGALAETPAEAAALTRTMRMLSREGLTVDLDELPVWSPISGDHLLGFLEGGSLRFTGGRWMHDVNLSTAAGQAEAARWADLPAVPPWTWGQVSNSVRWADTAVPVEAT